VHPESPVAQIALAPVAIPVGFATLLADVVMIHPLSTIPDCAKDSNEHIWANPEGGVMRQVFLFPLKIVATPIFFLGDLILRSLFDIR